MLQAAQTSARELGVHALKRKAFVIMRLALHQFLLFARKGPEIVKATFPELAMAERPFFDPTQRFRPERDGPHAALLFALCDSRLFKHLEMLEEGGRPCRKVLRGSDTEGWSGRQSLHDCKPRRVRKRTEYSLGGEN